MRGAGVGDGLGDGTTVGDAVWANASSGSLETVRPAAPSAGSSFTNVRLPTVIFRFLEVVFFFIMFGGFRLSLL
jgi:hypothetical protein